MNPLNVLLALAMVACAGSQMVGAFWWNQKPAEPETPVSELDGSFFFRQSFPELNKHLEAALTNNDLTPAVEIAKDLYDHPRKSQLGRDPAFRDSLRLFQAMGSLSLQEDCTAESAHILKNNYYAAFGYPWWGYTDDQEITRRRVNMIVDRIVRVHAHMCEDKYFEKFDSVKESVDKQSIETVNKLFANLLHQEKAEAGAQVWDNAQELFKFSLEKRFMYYEIVNHVQEALKNLRELGQNDPDLKYLEPQETGYQFKEMNKPKVEELVEKYLVQPCKVHNSQLVDIFEPAELDAMFQVDVKSDRLDYYQAWARYRYCSSLTSGSFEIVDNIWSLGTNAAHNEKLGAQ